MGQRISDESDKMIPGDRSSPGILAEKAGFEPALRSSRTTPLAGEPLRPLGYFSKPKCCIVKAGRPAGHPKWRRERDSNPRPLAESLVFKTSSINHSDISPHARTYYHTMLALSIPKAPNGAKFSHLYLVKYDNVSLLTFAHLFSLVFLSM